MVVLLSGRLMAPLLATQWTRPKYYAAPQTRPGDTLKNPDWLVWRTEQTASACAANIGLSPYKGNSPQRRWRILTGAERDDFQGNDATAYGELHEPRLRAIIRAVFGREFTVEEYGMFKDRQFKWMGISPDGVTNAIRLVGDQPHFNHDLGRWETRPFQFEMGKIMYEAKCSPNHEYLHPQVPHLVQIHMQMRVAQRWATLLHYWSRDRTRIFLVPFDPHFWKWQHLRMCLLHEHVVRNVPICETNPYFNYRLDSNYGQEPRYGCTLGDYCARTWFLKSKAANGPLRAPLRLQDWLDELKVLGMTHEEFVATPGYSECAPTIQTLPPIDADANDPADLMGRGEPRLHMPSGQSVNGATPPKPQVYELYHYHRQIPAEEREPGKPAYYVKPVDETNLEFFRSNYPSIDEYHAHQMAEFQQFVAQQDAKQAAWDEMISTANIQGDDVVSVAPRPCQSEAEAPWGAAHPDLIMDRLFIERVEAMPELDEPEPVDESHIFDSVEEEQAYRRRLAIEMAKYDARKLEEARKAEAAASIAALKANAAANAPKRQVQTSIQFKKPAARTSTLAYSPAPRGSAPRTPAKAAAAAAPPVAKKRALSAITDIHSEAKCARPEPNSALMAAPLVGSELRTLMTRALTLVVAHDLPHTAGSIIGLNIDDYCIETGSGLTVAQMDRAHRQWGPDQEGGLWPIMVVLATPPRPIEQGIDHAYPAPPNCITAPEFYLQASARHKVDGRRVSIFYNRAQFDLIKHAPSLPWAQELEWTDGTE